MSQPLRKGPSGPVASGFAQAEARWIADRGVTYTANGANYADIAGAALTLSNLKGGQQVRGQLLGNILLQGGVTGGLGRFRVRATFSGGTAQTLCEQEGEAQVGSTHARVQPVALSGLLDVPTGATSCVLQAQWGGNLLSEVRELSDEHSLELWGQIFAHAVISQATA